MWAMEKNSDNAVSRMLGALVLAMLGVATQADGLAAEAEPHSHVAIASDPSTKSSSMSTISSAFTPTG